MGARGAKLLRTIPIALTDGGVVNIDPHEMDDDLKLELDRELDELSADDLDLMRTAQPSEPQPDEKGRIPGRIIDVRGSDVFVDIGGKSEAFVKLDEFAEDSPPQPGERHTFMVQGIDSESGLTLLSLRQAKLEADFESLQVGDVIEARVTGVNLGGLELLAKSARAFMPKSQVDLERVADFTPFIGRRLECQITEIERKGHTLVVSRRKILERQREEMRQELKYSLAEGQTRRGVVRRLTDFGAFVDLGGIDGLVHISDMSYGRIEHPGEVVKEGEEVEVQVLKIDLVRDRISLGMKQLTPDPWNVVPGNYRVGQTVDGRVVKLMDFGVFVELEPGVEGLIPISEMSWTQRVRHPSDLLNENDSVRVVVLTVDTKRRRLTLSLKALGEDPWSGVGERYRADDIVGGAVTRVTGFGAFVQLEEGIEGLLHVSEMGAKRVHKPSEVVKVGDVVKVRVKSVDPEQRRISLSLRRLGESDGDTPQEPRATEAPAAKKRKRPLKGGLDW
ncbi:MAG: S1 RNA-binding domain-containing protein [Phycisphaerae bacterium]